MRLFRRPRRKVGNYSTTSNPAKEPDTRANPPLLLNNSSVWYKCNFGIYFTKNVSIVLGALRGPE